MKYIKKLFLLILVLASILLLGTPKAYAANIAMGIPFTSEVITTSGFLPINIEAIA